MRFNEFAQPPKQKTPEQARIDTLKQAKDRASDALTAERAKQKLQNAQKQILQISRGKWTIFIFP